MLCMDSYSLLKIFLYAPANIKTIASTSPYFCEILKKNVIGRFMLKYEIDENVYKEAIRIGSVECVEYLHKIGVRITEHDIVYAISKKRNECFKYLLKNVNYYYPMFIFCMICHYGNYELMLYMDSMMSENLMKLLLENTDKNLYCKCAIHGNNLECVKYVHKKYCADNNHNCANAIRHGTIESVKYLNECGCSIPFNSCDDASESGNVEILKYLNNNGYEMTKKSFWCAYNKGNYKCCLYMITHGCPFNEISWNSILMHIGIVVVSGAMSYYFTSPIIYHVNKLAGSEILPIIKI